MPKISELTAVSSLGTGDTFPVVQSGTTKKSTAQQIADLILASPTLTGTAVIPTINNASGVALQYNGSTKIATTSTGASVTGVLAVSSTITAANKTDGFAFPIDGKSSNSDRYPIGIAPYAFTVSQANSVGKALVAATGSTVYTLKKGTIGSPTTIGTFTWSAAGTTATVSISAGSVSAGDFLFLEGPATADATLEDLAFLITV